MKRIIPVLLLILFLYSSAFAQDEEYWSFGVKKHTPEEQEEYDRYWNDINGQQIQDDGSIYIGTRPTSEEEKRQIEYEWYHTASKDNGKRCKIVGSIKTIAESMNNIAQLWNEGIPVYSELSGDNCTFEITDYNKGLYTCPINYSTMLYVFTDRHLNPEVMQIYGRGENGIPKKTVYDWTFYATVYACMDLNNDDITDKFLETWNTGHYEDRYIEMVCGSDPYSEDTFVYIIANK